MELSPGVLGSMPPVDGGLGGIALPFQGLDFPLDLDQLTKCLPDAAARTKELLLSGEAGIGKSRLMEALTERLAEDPHTIWQFRCSAYHQNGALNPIIQFLDGLLGSRAPVKAGRQSVVPGGRRCQNQYRARGTSKIRTLHQPTRRYFIHSGVGGNQHGRINTKSQAERRAFVFPWGNLLCI